MYSDENKRAQECTCTWIHSD